MPKSRFPRIIHRIWLGKPIPQELEDWWKTWTTLNPEWECRTWSEGNLEPVIDELGLKPMYDWLTNLAQKSDIGRLALLWKYGGLYVDTDFECLKPIESLVRAWERAALRMVVAGEPPGNRLLVASAIGLAEPRHEAVRWMIGECERRLVRSQNYRHPPNPISTTGPGVWSAAAKRFPASVHVADSSIFTPFGGREMRHRRIGMSRIPDRSAIPSTAYAVHHSAALWTTWAGDW